MKLIERDFREICAAICAIAIGTFMLYPGRERDLAPLVRAESGVVTALAAYRDADNAFPEAKRALLQQVIDKAKIQLAAYNQYCDKHPQDQTECTEDRKNFIKDFVAAYELESPAIR